jgi:type III restriction enzyme
VAARARAAVEWCKSASTKVTKWEYLYVPQDVFQRVTRNSIDELWRACAPSLTDLLREAETPQMFLQFDKPEDQLGEQLAEFIEPAALERMSPRQRKAIEQAVILFQLHEKKEGLSFGPIFQPLLGPIDESAEALLLERLSGDVPAAEAEQKDFFEPDTRKKSEFLTERARTFKRLLVHRSPLMPTGLLIFALEYAEKEEEGLGGIFAAVRKRFADLAKTPLLDLVKWVYSFRNDYIAHEKKELNDVETTRSALKQWVEALRSLQTARQ